MKKGLFTGWKDVFSFTWKQSAGAKYQKTTAIVALILLVAGMAISIVMAFVQKQDDTYYSPIEKVYVVNNTDLTYLNLDAFGQMQGETFPNVSFEVTTKEVNVLATELSESSDVILQLEEITEEDAIAYSMTVLIPDGSAVSEEDGERLADAMLLILQQSKLLSSDIPVEKLAVALSGVNVNLKIAGAEEKSVGEELVQMFLPMILMFLLYMIVLIYGMSIGNVVSVEKSSKLMEMILTLTKPYGLILGKVVALSLSAMIQMTAWIAGLVVGFFAGHYIADTMIYPGYVNYLLEVFKLLNGKGGHAFSIPALVTGFVVLMVGFVLYSSLAALVASFASKTEELSTVMGYYQITMVAAFFAAYMLPMQEKEWINVILRFVPFTAAFKLPGDIIVGNIPLWQGFAYGGLLLVFVLVAALLAGVVYKNQIFNKGKNLLEVLGKKKA